MPVDRYGDALPGGAIARMGSLRVRNLAPSTGLAFSPDNKWLASAAADAILRIWETATGKEVRQFGIYEGVVAALAWSPDGRMLVSGGKDGSISLWDAETGRDLQRLSGHLGGVFAIAFTADGQTLLSAGADNVARLWDPNSGEALGEIGEGFGTYEVVAFGPDNTTMALGSWESTIRLCDMASGREIHQFRGPRVGVRSIVFSPDGRTLATGSVDGSIRIFEVSSGKDRWEFPKHLDGTYCVAYSADSRLLATSGADTTILVWDVTGQREEKAPGTQPLVAAQLPPLWEDLAKDDAARAYRAVRYLARSADVAVPFLKDKLTRLAAPDAREVAAWITDLSNSQLATRERATQELEKRGALVEPALRAAQNPPPPLEARRRLERLLGKLAEPVPSLLVLQGFRGVEALELIGTPEARRAVEAVGRVTPETRLSREAQAALPRFR